MTLARQTQLTQARAEREQEAEQRRRSVRMRLYPRSGRSERDLQAVLVHQVGSEWSSGVGYVLRDLEERGEAHQRGGLWFLGTGEREIAPEVQERAPKHAATAGAEPDAGEEASTSPPGLAGSPSHPGVALPHPQAVASTESGGTDPADAVEQAVELHAQDTAAEPAPATQAGGEPATPYAGWTIEWRDLVLVGRGPSGQRVTLGEIFLDGGVRHYELLHPETGATLKRARVANIGVGLDRATSRAQTLGARTTVDEAAAAPAVEPPPRLPYVDVARRMAEIVRRHPEGISPAAINAELGKGKRVNSDVQRRALRTARELGLVEARGATLQRKYFAVVKAGTEPESSTAESATPAAGLEALEKEIADLGRRAADLLAARARGEREVPSWPNHQPSAPALAAEPVSHTGSVARPTDVAAQPEAGASGGEASPGASASQAGPPSAREPETVGAEPAPVTGSSHAPLPAGDAPSPAVGTPGMHRQGVVSGVDPDPAASACYGRPPLEEQVSQLVAELEAVENERDALAAQLASERVERPDDVLAERWEERCREAQERIAELEADVARLAPQPAPVGGEGDCWAELLAHVGPSHPAAAMGAERRALGLARYGQPVRRGDGRDSARDLREELLDGAVYAWRDGRREALAVHLLDLAADPGRAGVAVHAQEWRRLAQEFQAERDTAHARLAELDPHGLFDLAAQAQARIAELEEDVQELAMARADLAIVDQILTPICGPTIPDDRRVRLGVLLARAPRWT